MANYQLTQTGAQVQNLLNDISNKAPTASPALTGVPTAPTATAGTNTAQIATTAFIKNTIDDLNLGNATVYYGTCSTAADVGIKEVVCEAYTKTGNPDIGDIIYVTFSNTNSVSPGTSLKLKVGSSTAKTIRYQASSSPVNLPDADYLYSKGTYRFTYNGTYWVVMLNYNANTQQRIYHTDNNIDYPIAGVCNGTSTGSALDFTGATATYKDCYSAIPTDTNKIATLNTSTGKITIPGSIQIGTSSTSSSTYTTTIYGIADINRLEIQENIIPINAGCKLGDVGWEWNTIYSLNYIGSAQLNGTPTAPTAAAGTNTTQIATTAFVQTSITDKQDKKPNGTALLVDNNTGKINTTYIPDSLLREVDARIPDYWESAVNTAIGKVETIQRAHGADCINLVWFSDIHLMASIGNSNYGRNIPALARRLINKLDIPFVISTGDSATNSVEPTEAAMRADFDYFNELVRLAGISDKLINCYGNHDGAWGDNRQGTEGYLAAYAWHVRPRDYWNDLIRNQTIGADRHYSADGTYGYVNLPAQKLRIIQLNSFWVGDNDTYYSNGTMIYDYFHHGGYGQAQLDWLANEALRFDDDGWSVVFIAHMPPASIDSTDYTAAANNRDATILNGILTAYANKTSYQGSYTYNAGRNEGAWANVSMNVDFSSESHYAKPIAFLAGHCHKSRVINDVLPFPIITITCATNSSYDSSTEGSRTNNTATETAFDVISICKDEEKIYLTRLGVGSDRETSYTPILPVINQIPISTDANGNIYNGTGYKDGYRYNSSNGETEVSGYFTTGRIPVKNGDVVTLDGFVFPQTTVSGGANVNFCRIVTYKSDGFVGGSTSDQVAIRYGGTVIDNQITEININTSTSFYSDIEYIALSGYGSGANAAIYVE